MCCVRDWWCCFSWKFRYTSEDSKRNEFIRGINKLSFGFIERIPNDWWLLTNKNQMQTWNNAQLGLKISNRQIPAKLNHRTQSFCMYVLFLSRRKYLFSSDVNEIQLASFWHGACLTFFLLFLFLFCSVLFCSVQFCDKEFVHVCFLLFMLIFLLPCT